MLKYRLGCVATYARSSMPWILTARRAENYPQFSGYLFNTMGPGTNICTTPGLLGRLWMAGHDDSVPSVSQQWPQSRSWPQWLWHLAGCCNLSASLSDSHTKRGGQSSNKLPLGLIVLCHITVCVCVWEHTMAKKRVWKTNLMHQNALNSYTVNLDRSQFTAAEAAG